MRKKWKKSLALWVAVLALLTLLPMTALAEEVGDFSVAGGTADDSYTYSPNRLAFWEPGDYTVEMRSGVTSTATDKIMVNAPESTADNPVHITLSSVDIQLSSVCAFEIVSGSYVRLTLSGDNRLYGGSDCAGLQTTGANLIIDAINPTDDSSGTLAAKGGRHGAGIGGSNGSDGGTVTILSGRIFATSGGNAAGLGGGFNGNGGTVVISGGDITASGYSGIGGVGGAGIGGGSVGSGSGGNGGSVTISGGHVSAHGDEHGAGIGGGFNGSDGGDIAISGGRVYAVGGVDAAGIGGGDGGDGGDGGIIAISGGTIVATGTGAGAGIGGGSQGDGAAVTITGGSITAIPGAALSFEYSIGGGYYGSAGTVRDGSGRDVYYTYVALEGMSAATKITSLTVDSGAYGISGMYADEYGAIYLYLPNGAHTTDVRAAGKRYTGDVTTCTDPGSSSGSLMWYRQIDADGTYNIGDYYTDGQTLHIDGGLNVTLTGSAGTTYTNFQLECGAGVNLTLQDVNIDDSANDDVCPLSFTGTDNMLTLAGVNTMKAGRVEPGVRVEAGTELTSGGAGSLITTGGMCGAGIGGGNNGNGGTVTISGGAVTATGNYGAGIGGGYYGNGGTVTISGGVVTATGGYAGAGIGGGYYGNGGTVSVSGGVVTATGGDYGVGIGGGYYGDGGTVTLTGGVTFAEGRNGGKDIGPGNTGSGGTLEITDTAAVFLRNGSSVVPVTTHTYQFFTGFSGDGLYLIPISWQGDFGAYLPLFSLTFDINGGAGAFPPAYGLKGATAAMSLPGGSGLSRAWYSFAGWNTAADGDGTAYAAGSNFTFSTDTVLYAQWTAESFTLTYDLDGGAVSPANPTSYTIESDAITLNNPTKADYTFTGWSGTDITGTSMSVTIPTGSAGNRSYTAHWAVLPATGTISGMVKDGNNNPISGADVRLTVSGSVYSATTAANGGYSMTNVPVGTGYTVVASKSGYTYGSVSNVSVTANMTTPNVNIILTANQEGCLVTYQGAEKKYHGDTHTYDICFIATINTLDAKEVGFVFSKSETTTIPTKGNVPDTQVKSTTTVYTSVTAAGSTVTAASYGETYIFACTVTGIPESDIDKPLYVRAFSTLGEETKYTSVVIVTANSLP